MLDKFQEICLGKHEIEILVLQAKMRMMHNEWEMIPQYIEELEDAQQQAKRAKMLIDDANLVMYVIRAMFSTERYLKSNYLWEDLDRFDRTWKEWKLTYTKANCKTIVKRMAADNLEQFGRAATSGTRGTDGGIGEGTKPPARLLYPVVIDELEGWFDSLAGGGGDRKIHAGRIVKNQRDPR